MAKCGAKTKSGKACKASALAGRRTCLFHTKIGRDSRGRRRFSMADAYKSAKRYGRK